MQTLSDLSENFIQLKSKLFNTLKHLKHQGKLFKRNLLVSIATITLSLITVTFMTGVILFANEVFITQNGETKRFLTTNEDTEEILKEFGYEKGEFDRIIRTKDTTDTIEITKTSPVEIEVDGETFTAGMISGEHYLDFLGSNQISVGKFDTVILSENKVKIIRGFGVDVTVDGETLSVPAVENLSESNGDKDVDFNNTGNATVDEILKRADISIGEGDIINLPTDKIVDEGDEVVVKRVSYREREYIEEIPFESTVEYSNLVEIGNTEVTGGVSGEMTLVLKEKLVDGVVVTSEVVKKGITREPVDKVTIHGAALKTPYSKRDFPEIKLENGIPVDYVDVVSGQSTAYTAPLGARTASGRDLIVGTVAVNPEIIPYGSLLYIVSQDRTRVYGAAIAADTGGFINYTDRFVAVDLFMGTTDENYSEALRWGLQPVDVFVINKGVY